MNRKLQFSLVAACALFTGSAARAVSINFDSVPGGVPSDGEAISTQYQASDGVTFGTADGGTPRLAEVGSPVTAFMSKFGQDTPAPGQNLGNFFLTAGTPLGPPPPPVLVNFVNPVASVGGDILDIDGKTAGAESWRVDALNSSGLMIDSVTLTQTSAGAGDGMATPFAISHTSADISSLEITFTGSKTTGVGLGFDNFTASATPAPGAAVPLPPAVWSAGATLLALGGIARLRRTRPF